MNKQITSYTYAAASKELILTYDDDTSETFTEADAERYIQLTGRLADAISIGWDVSFLKN